MNGWMEGGREGVIVAVGGSPCPPPLFYFLKGWKGGGVPLMFSLREMCRFLKGKYEKWRTETPVIFWGGGHNSK